MEWHLRLADRRGLLQGRNLSPAAIVGLELLQFADMRERAKQFWNSVRVSLIAGGVDDPARIQKIFPELFVAQVKPIDEDTDIDDIDPASIEWVAPTTSSEIDEYMALQQELEKNRSGQLSVGREGLTEEGWV
jgi:hypothetical protein